MNTRHTLRTIVLSALAMGTGCNTWIDYPEDFTTPTAVTVAPTEIDLDFPEVKTLQHFGFAAIIERYSEVKDGRVMIDYDGFAVDSEARFLLNQYVGLVGTLDPSKLANKNERLAFWINGYNALMVKGILDRACLEGSDPADADSPQVPKKDGCDHTFSTFAGMFFDVAYTVSGQVLTLDQIEHGVLRGNTDHDSLANLSSEVLEVIAAWHKSVWEGKKPDARIHAGLNCGVVGCPNLNVYTGATIDARLDEVTRQWLDDPSKGAGPQGISRIFDWFKDDFVGSHGGVDAFIRKFRTDGLDTVDMGTFLTYDDRLHSIENQ